MNDQVICHIKEKAFSQTEFPYKILSSIFYSTAQYITLRNIFMLTTAILSIFIVRLLTPVEYGKWALVYQLIATIGPIINFGFLSTLAKFIPEYTDEKKKNELFSQSLFIVICIFLLFSLLFTLGTSLFPSFIPQEIKVIKYPFMFFIGSLALINSFEGYYRGLGKFNQWAIIDGTRSVLSAGLAILLILVLSNKFEVVFYTYFSIAILFLIFLFCHLRENLNLNLNLNSQITKFALTMFIGQVIFLLMSNVNPVLLRSLLKDPKEVGYYFAGIRLPQLFEVVLLGHFTAPFLFYFSHPDTSQAKERIIEEGTKILGTIFGFISLVSFSFADKILPFLFGEIYLKSIPVLKIYSFWIFLFSLQVFATSFFISINKPLLLLTLGFIFFILNLSLNILFIPQLKAQGAALASIIAIFFLISIYFYFYERHGVKIITKVWLVIGGLVFSLLVGIFINPYLCPIIFVIVSLVTRLDSKKEINLLKKLLRNTQ